MGLIGRLSDTRWVALEREIVLLKLTVRILSSNKSISCPAQDTAGGSGAGKKCDIHGQYMERNIKSTIDGIIQSNGGD